MQKQGKQMEHVLTHVLTAKGIMCSKAKVRSQGVLHVVDPGTQADPSGYLLMVPKGGVGHKLNCCRGFRQQAVEEKTRVFV